MSGFTKWLQHLGQAEDITRALAALDPIAKEFGKSTDTCRFCGARGSLMVIHRSDCIWQRAQTFTTNTKEN